MFCNEHLYKTVKSIYENNNKLNDNLSQVTNPKEIIALKKEIAKNKDVVSNFLTYEKTINSLQECWEMIKVEKNPEFLSLAQDEFDFLKKELARLEDLLQTLLLPKDPNDEKNVIVEMRPAAGGDESSIFVSNLFDAYKRYADNNKWKLTINDIQEGNVGISSLTFSLAGKNVYSKMKFESGVHRVQRVPATESKGRVHTSTITVSILPEQNEVEVDIDPNDLRIDVYRASGAGGQHVNKTESAVRIIHLPTNIMVACQQERSQLSNREQAMTILRAKVWELKNRQQNEAISNMVREQVGRGMRSEKIRTYNYPQNRITDHRILLTINNLESVMMGDFTVIHEALINNEAKENLQKSLENCS